MKKRVKKINKQIPTWCKVILFGIVIMALNIHITSSVTKSVLHDKMENAAEMVITDMESFTDLQHYFQNRFNADGSVTYLLQPKSYIKIYKQAINIHANDSLYISVPLKVSLLDEKKFQMELKSNEYVRLDENSIYENTMIVSCNDDFKTAYVFPIYHYRTHVSEFIIFFKDDVHLTKEQIIEYTTELQSFSRLIK